MSVPVRRKIEVVTDFLDRTGNLDFDSAGQLLAENAVMIMPFVDEMPRLEGRTAIIDQMRSVIPRMFERMNFAYDAWYDVCNEEDTLIAEYHSECPWTGGAGTYRNSYITVFRFEGDKISELRIFMDSAPIGTKAPIPELVSVMTVAEGEKVTPPGYLRKFFAEHPEGIERIKNGYAPKWSIAGPKWPTKEASASAS